MHLGLISISIYADIHVYKSLYIDMCYKLNKSEFYFDQYFGSSSLRKAELQVCVCAPRRTR